MLLGRADANPLSAGRGPQHRVADLGRSSAVGEGRQSLGDLAVTCVGVHRSVGVHDVVLKALGIALGMARGQRGEPTLLRLTLVRVAYQHLGACLAPDPQLLGLFLIKDRTLMHAIDLDPQAILAAGTELADHR